MKYRKLFNIVFGIVLAISIFEWFAAGLSSGLQQVSNPEAVKASRIALVVVVISVMALLIFNFAAMKNRKD